MAPSGSPARARAMAPRALHAIRRRDPRLLRLVVICPAAAWIAASFAARQADVAPTEDLADVAHTLPVWVGALVVALATGALVAQWWALVVALAPIGVALLLVFLGTWSLGHFGAALEWAVSVAAMASLGIGVSRMWDDRT